VDIKEIFSKENTERLINEDKERSLAKANNRKDRNNKRTTKTTKTVIPEGSLKQFYVYVLIDPRDEKIFYVGKGTEDRLFQHAKEVNRGAEETAKQKKILEIQVSGNEVKHVVVGRFDSPEEALGVECVLIHWVYGIANLTNIASGHGVDNIRPKGNLEDLPGIDEPDLDYCERTKNNRGKNDIIPFLEEIRELIEDECGIKFDDIHTNNDRHTYLVKFVKGVRLTIVSHHTAKRAAAVTIESLDGKKQHKERVKEICEQTKIECKDNGRYGRIMPAGSHTDPYIVLDKFKETLSELNKVF
jgi:hypothetical protein